MRPFTDDAHESLRRAAREVARAHAGEADPRRWVALLGDAGVLRLPPEGDLRSLCVVREEVAWASPLGDVMVAIQALGGYAMAKFGPGRPPGIAGFALTEPEAGSDVGGIRTRAAADGATWRLDGHKWFISNAGVADWYVVFARTAPLGEKRGLSAFFVEASAPGLTIAAQQVSDPHPIGELRFSGTPATLVGTTGQGMAIALGTLDVLRASVGAAACGFARRALDEACAHVRARTQFGQALAEFQLVQAAIADAATDLDAARALVYRAAWAHDRAEGSPGASSSMAKLFATEAAQRIVDASVQLHGGQGVLRDHVVERLYRAVRALRIYEGTSEIQKLIIARSVLS